LPGFVLLSDDAKKLIHALSFLVLIIVMLSWLVTAKYK